MASNEALAVAKKQGTLRYQMKKNKACYIMLAPYFILFFLFTLKCINFHTNDSFCFMI